MNNNRGKKLVVPRSRIASASSSTPTVKGSQARGSSTPTNVSANRSNNQSCMLTPIKKVDTSGNQQVSERTEPKLLKPLGPTLKPKPKSTPEDQISFLYMMAQQQEFLNVTLEETQNRVLKESDDQLEKLWAMVREKERQVAHIKYTTSLVQQHTRLSKLKSELETTLTDTREIVKQVAEIAQILADGLQVNRNKMPLVNLNPPSTEDLAEINRLLEVAAASAGGISTNQLAQAVDAASAINRLESYLTDQIKVMEETQRLSSRTILRLGQELALSDDTTEFMSLNDLEI